jgi:Fe2+ transport system protein FeoA
LTLRIGICAGEEIQILEDKNGENPHLWRIKSIR